jgi:hypothetical protein
MNRGHEIEKIDLIDTAAIEGTSQMSLVRRIKMMKLTVATHST